MRGLEQYWVCLTQIVFVFSYISCTVENKHKHIYAILKEKIVISTVCYPLQKNVGIVCAPFRIKLDEAK